MKPNVRTWSLVCLWISGSLVMGKMTPEQVASLPAPASHKIDFTKEIKPIFDASCIKCHGRGKSKGGFRLDTRETLLEGGDSGPAVVSGKSAESYLIELVAGVDPDNVMPVKGSKLKTEEVALLRAWIDQGMSWDEGVSFGKLDPVNLEPRKPELPAAAIAQNPIDRILSGYYEKNGIKVEPRVSDRIFARRVYLDVIGLLPSPQELEDFLEDDRSDKRQRLVRKLLADNRRYAEHWLTFWNDLLRNDYKGTGFIDNGRKQITGWLYAALANNMPYDRFVSELIDPVPDSEGFTKGIVWRGVVNASMTPQMQAAQNISQVFMGVNLKCASCHDSFINDWTLADAYGLASIYSDEPLEMVECDKPTGHKAMMKFIYPDLGDVDATLPKKERMKRLAQIMTSEKNGRLSRTIVNRLWARFMGHGLVEPVDEMESPAWNPDLLDWLASDLVENGYDLKKTIARILTSDAYQMPTVAASEQEAAKDFVFKGPIVRRLSAEQYVDALASITGVWKTLPEPKIELAGATATLARSSIDQPAQPKWIWTGENAASKAKAGTVYFRKSFNLSKQPTAASVTISCDNSFKLFINGHEAGSGREHGKPNLIDIRKHLKAGENVIAVQAVNDMAAPDKKEDASFDQSNPAGLILYARIRHESKSMPAFEKSQNVFGRTKMAKSDKEDLEPFSVETIMDLASDSSWLCSTEKKEGWEKSDASTETWQKASELGSIGMAPWNLEEKFKSTMAISALYGEVRASLVAADPLMVALGRPNREQVITTRASVATTLQALEMTNGNTLSDQLKQGADQLVKDYGASSRKLVVSLYQRALSRKPTTEELKVAEEVVGTPASEEGVEDLLWAMTMLPEFQLIY